MENAYINLHCTRADGTRDTFHTIKVPAKDAPLWWHDKGISFTASGYGSRIPTRHMVLLNGKWRRVYCRIYSNAGTCYIGKDIATGFIVQEAASIVWAKTLAHCLKLIVEGWNGETIHASGLLWWDKINGNTYHSARITIPGEITRIVDVPYQYGYGDQWQWSVRETLQNVGFCFPKDVPFYQLPIQFGAATYTKKKCMYSGVYLSDKSRG